MPLLLDNGDEDTLNRRAAQLEWRIPGRPDYVWNNNGVEGVRFQSDWALSFMPRRASAAC